jgi:FMN reductase
MRARVVVVVGNPRPASRTRDAGVHLATELAGRAPDRVLELAELGPRLFDLADTEIADLVEEVGRADLVVVASPTYKATYTGLLKLFLDRFAGGTGLRGVAVPLMLIGSPGHALAGELHLRPLLAELGATTTRAAYVLEKEFDRAEAYSDWLDAVRPSVAALLTSHANQGVAS